jgi:hypothetical protein
MSSPLSQVMQAVTGGATTPGAIVATTGLDPDVVDGALDHLLRLGRISTPILRSSCPESGCAGCGSTDTECSPRATGRRVSVTIVMEGVVGHAAP